MTLTVIPSTPLGLRSYLVKSVVAKAAPAVLMTDVVEAVDEATVLRLREARREASSPAQVVIAEIAEAKKRKQKSLFHA